MKLEVTKVFQNYEKQETQVWLKGCPLRCDWCAEPRVKKPKKELLYDMDSCIECMVCFPACPTDAHELINSLHLIDRYKCVGCMVCADLCPAGALEPASQTLDTDAIVGRCPKAMVLGGGEPLVHHEAVVELLQKAKAKGLATCIETTGVFYPSQIPAIMPYTDRFVFRIMDTDPVRMKKNTGAKLEVLLSNLKKVDEAGGKTTLRCKLIPGVNMDAEHAKALASLYAGLQHCEGITIEPYVPAPLSKWKQLDLIPPSYPKAEEAAVQDFVEILKNAGVPIIE